MMGEDGSKILENAREGSPQEGHPWRATSEVPKADEGVNVITKCVHNDLPGDFSPQVL